MRSLLFSLVQKLLLFLPPERAHCLAIWGMRLWQKLLGKNTFSVLRNPKVGLAAGFDKQAQVAPFLSSLGFGFLELGTVTPRPQKGNPKPRIWRVPQGLVNAMGFNSVGAIQFKKNLERHRKRVGSQIWISLGKNRETPEEDALIDYLESAKCLGHLADGFVINISSPNTPGLQDLQSVGFLQNLKREWSSPKPLWIKFSPDVEELSLLLTAVRDLNFTGVVLSNTSRKVASELKFSKGGYSGPELFPRTLKAVALARKILKADQKIVACGGIDTIVKAEQVLAEGADAVQIYTAFVYQGPAFVRRLCQKIK